MKLQLPGPIAWMFPVLLVAGCDCNGDRDRIGAPCTSTCSMGRVCIDAHCQLPVGIDGRPQPGAAACAPEERCASSGVCCARNEECVDGFACSAVCANERCGENRLVCCADGQVCLDGVVCATSCETDRALCSAALDTCCAAHEVCIGDACVEPGDACTDDFDCLTEGAYCEPTISRCLAIPGPPLCELRPDFDRVAIEIEWHWSGVMIDGKLYANVVSAPTVGDVSGDGIPDVVVGVYPGSSLDTGALVAIHGRTGMTLWSVGGTNGGTSQGTPALANLDTSDDALEIVAGVTVSLQMPRAPEHPRSRANA